ncbi:hypothetical protein [Thermopirellula anaerolimosa]
MADRITVWNPRETVAGWSDRQRTGRRFSPGFRLVGSPGFDTFQPAVVGKFRA